MHAEYTAIMSLVLDHRATEMERQNLHMHLADCPDCLATWEQFRLLDRGLSALPVLDAPPGFAGRVLARLHHSRERSHSWQWLGPGLVLTWLAVLVTLPLIAGLLIWWGASHPIEASVMLSALARLASVVSAALRALGSVVTSVGSTPLIMGWGLLIGVTGGLGLLWAWLVFRAQPLMRSSAVTRS